MKLLFIQSDVLSELEDLGAILVDVGNGVALCLNGSNRGKCCTEVQVQVHVYFETAQH